MAIEVRRFAPLFAAAALAACGTSGSSSNGAGDASKGSSGASGSAGGSSSGGSSSGLTTDATSPSYATSIFNPSINIDIGVYGVSDNRKQEKQKFTGCTEDQYTLMAIGDYNSYGSTKSCTVFNTAYDDEVLKTYTKYAQEAGWPAHPY